MYQIKNIVNFADYLFGLIWGYSLIELVPFIGTHNLLSNTDEKLKTYVLILGLFYGIARLIFFCMKGIRENAKAILEEKKMEQEIANMKTANFYEKIKNDEFLKEK